MEQDEFGSDVAGIIVAENGQLVSEDLWNGWLCDCVSRL